MLLKACLVLDTRFLLVRRSSQIDILGGEMKLDQATIEWIKKKIDDISKGRGFGHIAIAHNTLKSALA